MSPVISIHGLIAVALTFLFMYGESSALLSIFVWYEREKKPHVKAVALSTHQPLTQHLVVKQHRGVRQHRLLFYTQLLFPGDVFTETAHSEIRCRLRLPPQILLVGEAAKTKPSVSKSCI